MEELEKEVEVRNRAGLHTRPAAMLVKLSAKYHSEIYLIKDGFTINAKSIIGVMTLAAEFGAKLMVRAEGIDAKEAIDGIAQLFDDGFGEP
ncbi:MAG TPA: HPr family phosphocarrier protein [Candidatus Kapabacteria bacterium]|nr:HPr family phosphocarrier protein [Candidatus Kapabacteria bacterium]